MPEAANTKNELFGTDRMLVELNKDIYAPVEELLRNVRGEVSEYAAGAEQFDDLTMLAVEYIGTGTK